MAQYLPDTAQGNDGAAINAWAEYLAGTSGDMRIKGRYRASGDTAFGSTFTFKDSAGSEIHCVDGGFGNVAHAHAGHAPWTLAIIYTGETDLSCWWSTDEGLTWTRY